MIGTQFLLTSLVVVLIPGTGVIYTVSTGLFLGRRFSVAAALGCTLGIVPHLTASVLGLSAILHMSAMAFQTLKYVGALYLLYLAWCMWRTTGGMEFNRPAEKNSFFKIALRGILINILNPKLTLFFVAFLPLFVSHDATLPVYQMLLLSAVFMAMTLIVFIFYGLLAGALRTYVVDSPRIVKRLERSFAAIFALLAAKLALSER